MEWQLFNYTGQPDQVDSSDSISVYNDVVAFVSCDGNSNAASQTVSNLIMAMTSPKAIILYSREPSTYCTYVPTYPSIDSRYPNIFFLDLDGELAVNLTTTTTSQQQIPNLPVSVTTNMALHNGSIGAQASSASTTGGRGPKTGMCDVAFRG